MNTRHRLQGVPASYKVGLGLCTPLGLRVYNGNGDNKGTTQEERRDECSKACKEKKTPVFGSWSKGDAVGFGLTEQNGRCWCQHEKWASCNKQHTQYAAYEYGTRAPTKAPTAPTKAPTKRPTKAPTKAPTSKAPTKAPTNAPSFPPSGKPSTAPTHEPTVIGKHPVVVARAEMLRAKYLERKAKVKGRLDERTQKIQANKADSFRKMRFEQHKAAEMMEKHEEKLDMEDGQMSNEKKAKLDKTKLWNDEDDLLKAAITSLQSSLEMKNMALAAASETVEFLENQRKQILMAPAYTPLGAHRRPDQITCPLRVYEGSQVLHQSALIRISTADLFPEDKVLRAALRIYKTAGFYGELRLQQSDCTWP